MTGKILYKKTVYTVIARSEAGCAVFSRIDTFALGRTIGSSTMANLPKARDAKPRVLVPSGKP
jgi:hypothetical protein